ncbi:hypothetical protein F4780DRAFT_660352 [Xylariomycetidae sp. FL0641]|nr:hypothetical protein F4780DRAFT_660352 [Xylariomycetidae sp. FL0641]
MWDQLPAPRAPPSLWRTGTGLWTVSISDRRGGGPLIRISERRAWTPAHVRLGRAREPHGGPLRGLVAVAAAHSTFYPRCRRRRRPGLTVARRAAPSLPAAPPNPMARSRQIPIPLRPYTGAQRKGGGELVLARRRLVRHQCQGSNTDGVISLRTTMGSGLRHMERMNEHEKRGGKGLVVVTIKSSSLLP